jgi:ribosome biogenesis GTPase / thiamine phosphate phosphatase
MFISQRDYLIPLGWTDFFESQYQSILATLTNTALVPARVICEERELYRVQTGLERTKDESILACVSGKFKFSSSRRTDYPAVGDWVLIEAPDHSDRAVIHELLPRKSVIYRKQIGSSADQQILSANIDTIFITTSLNGDLNFRRIERYLSIAWESGAVPVLLLTKADTFKEDLAKMLFEVETQFPGVSVHALSQNEFERAEFLTTYLQAGKTAVFLGSSGVGKSTLVNYLTGQDQIRTQSIRDSDSKGRHTTTSRNLYISRFGGLVIDTPGMRELQLSDHEEGLSTQFADIEDFVLACKFGDCKHATEPGCAIKAALTSGELTTERWESYRKLQAEVRHALRKQDKALASEDRKAWKKLGEIGRANLARKRDR